MSKRAELELSIVTEIITILKRMGIIRYSMSLPNARNDSFGRIASRLEDLPRLVFEVICPLRRLKTCSYQNKTSIDTLRHLKMYLTLSREVQSSSCHFLPNLPALSTGND